KPSNKSPVVPRQTADAEKAFTPQAQTTKGSEFLPAVDEGLSAESAAEAAVGNETLQSPATPEKAPASPEEDSAYQAVVGQLAVKAKQEKTPVKKPDKKQLETKFAANLTPEEIAKQNAYGNHLNNLEQVKPHELTVETFMGEFKATTTELAANLPKDKEDH